MYSMGSVTPCYKPNISNQGIQAINNAKELTEVVSLPELQFPEDAKWNWVTLKDSEITKVGESVNMHVTTYSEQMRILLLREKKNKRLKKREKKWSTSKLNLYKVRTILQFEGGKTLFLLIIITASKAFWQQYSYAFLFTVRVGLGHVEMHTTNVYFFSCRVLDITLGALETEHGMTLRYINHLQNR